MYISLLMISLSVLADVPVVKKRQSGIYTQIFKNESFAYMVDPRTHLCFVTGTLQRTSVNGDHLERIPCKNLKLRTEWKNIIAW